MVRGSARGSPGVRATGPKYQSRPARRATRAGDQPLAQQGRQAAQAVALETAGGKGGRQGVDREEAHAGVGAEPAGERPRQVTAREVGAGHHDDLAQRVVALDGGDPGGQGSLELRAVAEDESSAAAVG